MSNESTKSAAVEARVIAIVPMKLRGRNHETLDAEIVIQPTGYASSVAGPLVLEFDSVPDTTPAA